MYVALKLYNNHRTMEDFDKLKNYVDAKNSEPLVGASKWFMVAISPIDYDILKRTGKLMGEVDILYDPFGNAEKDLKTFTNNASFKRTFGGKDNQGLSIYN